VPCGGDGEWERSTGGVTPGGGGEGGGRGGGGEGGERRRHRVRVWACGREMRGDEGIHSDNRSGSRRLSN
jgi:hypothetical protein